MSRMERRKSPRKIAHLLVSVRRLDKGVKWSGFARTLNLSEGGVLIETPDAFRVDEPVALELLLDDNKIAPINGRVTRVTKVKAGNHISVAFDKPPPKVKRLLAKQVNA